MKDHYFAQRGLVLGFHGCDREFGEDLIAGRAVIQPSEKPYDWLGGGVYFWENNPERALEWAEDRKQLGKVKEPFVVGAVIDLGNCFNLLESRYLETLPVAYDVATQVEGELRANENPSGIDSPDRVIRYRDCAVIRYAISLAEEDSDRKFDSVRAAFLEGPEAYPGAGFRLKNHVQICIRNPNCVKGLFSPLSRQGTWAAV